MAVSATGVVGNNYLVVNLST